ncbi:DMT family transporter [Candidatus Uhrbacteria bacterium]|nr:DMT family transporter [Candidatus Uhrbacteria bacterium]
MSWLLIVIIAHLLNAGAFLVDKFLLAKAVPKPAVYAFWIGMLGLFALVLLPFGSLVFTPREVVFALFAGFTFEIALLFFFGALRRLETSRVVPVVGGLQPLIIFLLSYTFLGERLSQGEFVAFVLLLLGSVVISYDTDVVTERETAKRRRGWLYAFVAAFLFAVSYALTKHVFGIQSFVSGFVWIRIGAFLTVLLFLLRREWRHDILGKQERPKGKLGLLFLGGQSAGAVSAILLNYAISLASVTIITAMQGMQYVFLFLIAMVLGRRYTQLRERLSTAIVLRKSTAIILIGVGLVLLAR